MVELYNSLKAGVDTLDRATGSYSCKRRTDRYPLAIFLNFLDICGHNSFHTFLAAHPTYLPNDRSKKRKYLDWLSKELALKHVKSRKNETGLHHEVKSKIELFIRNFEDMYGESNSPTSICLSCTSTDDLKVCESCGKTACSSHCRKVQCFACPNCFESQNEFPELQHITRKSKRCSFCPRNKDVKTMISCVSCNSAICERHVKRESKYFDICRTCMV